VLNIVLVIAFLLANRLFEELIRVLLATLSLTFIINTIREPELSQLSRDRSPLVQLCSYVALVKG
jgi:hypothetical protein